MVASGRRRVVHAGCARQRLPTRRGREPVEDGDPHVAVPARWRGHPPRHDRDLLTTTRRRGRTMGVLDGKVAVVTGASSGSGRGIAKRFVEEGASVVMLARGQERLAAAASEFGERAIPVTTD